MLRADVGPSRDLCGPRWGWTGQLHGSTLPCSCGIFSISPWQAGGRKSEWDRLLIHRSWYPESVAPSDPGWLILDDLWILNWETDGLDGCSVWLHFWFPGNVRGSHSMWMQNLWPRDQISPTACFPQAEPSGNYCWAHSNFPWWVAVTGLSLWKG